MIVRDCTKFPYFTALGFSWPTLTNQPLSTSISSRQWSLDPHSSTPVNERERACVRPANHVQVTGGQDAVLRRVHMTDEGRQVGNDSGAPTRPTPRRTMGFP